MSTTVEGSLVVVYQPVSTLVSYPNNARTHSNHQIRQIARSIREFGFTNPILIDKNNTIIAGHGRLLAAQMVGISRKGTTRIAARDFGSKESEAPISQSSLVPFEGGESRIMPGNCGFCDISCLSPRY